MAEWKAIAAMSENRVIGNQGKIPWYLPEDFKWFKQTTMGHVLVMGRKTFDSIGRVLPGRTTVVMTRGNWSHPDVKVIRDLSELAVIEPSQQIFIAGGAEIYALALPNCEELYLTVVKRVVAGDVFLPPFESYLEQAEVVKETPEFRIERWTRIRQ